MKVHHLDCATLCPRAARLLNGEGGWLGEARMVCHCLLLETGGGLTLVDTGLGTADVADPKRRLGPLFSALARPRLRPEQTALAQVERLGFKRSDVRHIVPTHLDLDHAGGLSDFPQAEIHVFEPELRAAMERKTTAERARYRVSQASHAPRWVTHRLEGDQFLGFERVCVLGQDVALIPLIGHTRGHCAVAVRDARGWLLHAGDAYFFHAEMDAASPHCPAGLAFFQSLVAVDDGLRRGNQARLRSLVRDQAGRLRVFCAHDPTEYDRMASQPDDPELELTTAFVAQA